MKQGFQTLLIGAVLLVMGGISSSVAQDFTDWSDAEICGRASNDGYWSTLPYLHAHVKEAKRRGLVCGVKESLTTVEPVYFCEVTHIAVLENDKPPIISHNSGERIKFSFNNDRVKFSQDSWFFKGGKLELTDHAGSKSWISVNKAGTTDFVSPTLSYASTNFLTSISFRARCDLF